jgi:uncharacterized MAPEG superfamily protein
MTIADICILIAALMPYIAAGYAKSHATNFDNGSPRDPAMYTGAALRAYNAQLNCFEVFPFFAVAVILAEFRSSAHLYIDILAILFIVIRIVYLNLYITNKSNARTPVWSLGLLITILLFILPVFFH